jgi:hypothetical protein
MSRRLARQLDDSQFDDLPNKNNFVVKYNSDLDRFQLQAIDESVLNKSVADADLPDDFVETVLEEIVDADLYRLDAGEF